MSPETSNVIEYLALDGPVGPVPAVALGLVLLAVCGWSLWRERCILGRRNTIFFWLLRAAALATVIWMLLAPMNVRVETSHNPPCRRHHDGRERQHADDRSGRKLGRRPLGAFYRRFGR